MLVKSCYISNTGKVRSTNEDGLLINGYLICETNMDQVKCEMPEGERMIFTVADGMGGHQKGELASRAVLSVFMENYRLVTEQEQIRDIIRLAKHRLNSIARADRYSFGLGTTVSGLILFEGRAIVFNCGDSRVYRIRGSSLERITRDHSLVQELADRGIITEEEMRTHPQKHIITSAVTGDLKDELPEVSLEEFALEQGQRFLLCTDGLWESMERTEMEKCFLVDDIERATYCLFRKMMAGEASDNVTMITVEAVSP